MTSKKKSIHIDWRRVFDSAVLCAASIAFAICAITGVVDSYISWIGFACSLAGQIMIIYKIPFTFVVWNTANIIWLVLAYQRGDTAQVAMFSMYFIANSVAIYKWRE